MTSYGWQQDLITYSNLELPDQNLGLRVGVYNFFFSKKDLALKMKNSNEYDINFELFSSHKYFINDYLKDNVDLQLTQNKTRVKFRDKELDLDLSTNILFSLDKLVKEGRFYLEKEGKVIKSINYKYRMPQFQGEIYSRWIDDKTEINKIHYGFVD